jgi:hypothetical protein
MRTVLLPLGGYPIAVNKYIISDDRVGGMYSQGPAERELLAICGSQDPLFYLTTVSDCFQNSEVTFLCSLDQPMTDEMQKPVTTV